MNERIKELYRQAHMVREYPLDDPMRGGNPPTVYWGGECSAERFAELLIRECVTMLEQHHPFTKESEAYLYAISLIEEHFGVEE